MQWKTDRHRIIFSGILLLAFMLLAGSLMQFSLSPGFRIESGQARTPAEVQIIEDRVVDTPGNRALGLVVSVIVAISGVLVLVGLLRRESRLSTAASLVFSLLLSLLLASMIRGTPEPDPDLTADTFATESGGVGGAAALMDSEEDQPEQSTEPQTPWFWSVAVIVVTVGGAVAVLWRSIKRPETRAVPSVRDAVDGAAGSLEAGEELAGVIIQCYRDMVAAVEESRSIRRGSALTPREFERLLEREGLAPADVRALTRLFELARYSNSPSSREGEEKALQLLRSISSALKQGDGGD